MWVRAKEVDVHGGYVRQNLKYIIPIVPNEYKIFTPSVSLPVIPFLKK
jgi:hypothetical protein